MHGIALLLLSPFTATNPQSQLRPVSRIQAVLEWKRLVPFLNGLVVGVELSFTAHKVLTTYPMLVQSKLKFASYMESKRYQSVTGKTCSQSSLWLSCKYVD